MNNRFSLLLAQINATVGALQNNADKAELAHREAVLKGADAVLLPEMFLTGYQIQDLVFKRSFIDDVQSTLKKLALRIKDGPPMLIGAPELYGNSLFNSFFRLYKGKLDVISRKHHLPNNDVFDERRLFSSGAISPPYNLSGVRIGSPICEDFWYADVAKKMVLEGAEILISPNGSPYSRKKIHLRQELMAKRAKETNVPIVYLNLVGGQDDLVFDGGSFVLNPCASNVVQLPQFDELTAVVKFSRPDNKWVADTGLTVPVKSELSQDYRAMAEGTRDYVKKSGFSQILLGLSGGVDSALVATIACDALGPENVLCVRLPSEVSSASSLEDAKNLADQLLCKLETIPISETNTLVQNTLSSLFKKCTPDTTEENIQSRLRGLFLMALSNKFNRMLLTTGNKSEVAVGYSTIYGDMAGGYNPIKDLYKMRVFETCLWRNQNYESWMLGPKGAVIPKNIITKPPSAELRPDQRDDDTLPPYPILDKILEGLIDDDLSVGELVTRGFEEKIVKLIESLVYLSEYKRYQSAPGVHLTDRSFWSSRRYPLVQKWRDEK